MDARLYNLTNPQKSIWLTEKFYQETSINTICGYVYITNEVHFDVLKNAINEMVKTNDGMRLRIKEENNSCLQYVSDFKPFNIDLIELSSKEEMESAALKMANTPFMKENENLFQFVLFRLPNNSGGFIVNVHHLIGDSWSLGLIAKAVTTIYSDLLSGTYQPQNAPSYLNYIEAENDYKNSDKYIKDKAYWDDVFSTIPEIASIPSTKNDSQKAVFCEGKREKFELAQAELNEIKAFCDKYKISIYNFFMAAYSLYISRVSNLEDFVIGTPILNRTNFEQKHTMGMFISVAPLRVTLNSELSFVDFAKKIATDTMSVFRHQKYSYQTILEDIRKRDSSIPNLYNVILSYQITKTVEENSEVSYSTDWVFNGYSSDELQIHLFDLNDEASMTVAYDYKAELFEPQEISNLHNRILAIIKEIISNEAISLKDIEIVTPEEKHKILYDFNNTTVDYPRDKTIVDLFEEQVEKTPDNIAVVFEEQKLTYRELNEKANQLANYLLTDNVLPNDIVCLLLDKSLESIISIMAILKVGATYLPIDVNYPNERIDYIIRNSGSTVLLTTKNNIHKSTGTIQTLCIDLENAIYSEYSPQNVNCKNISPDSLAYIMYTSGSTGNPKGVMVSHRNIVRLIKNNKFIEFDKYERILQTGSIVFDACTFEIFGSLLNGFELYIIKKEELLDASLLQDYLIKNKITTLWLTAPLFNQLCEENPHMFSTVKKLLTGGDVLSPKHINMVRAANPDLTVINGYGPTENTTFSCCFTIDKKYTNSIPIGGPISNSTAYVVSPLGKLCPIGVPGELWVGGDGVGKGYLNNDDLTNEKFIQNPFGDGIVYKTGDLVKWLPNGTIDFIGRIDNQVKIRGFRVELSEIDRNILLQSSDIKQALTIVRNINSAKTICSYIVSVAEIDISDLKHSLEKHLPAYMIPTFITQLKEFPLTINGKIDSKALPMPSISNVKKDIVPARNELDNSIIRNLSKILGVTNISIADSFFDLGGDSLSAISFTNVLKQTLNVSITVSDIFEHPVIKDLSDYIATLSESGSKSTIKNVEKRSYYPASSAQKRIYYASSIDSDSVLYNIAGGVIIDKNLDITLLQQCFQALIGRHEVLRTHFAIIENEIVQVIEDKLDFTLTTENAKSNDLNNIYADFVKPFDLEKAPLFRAKVVELENNKMLLLLDMHHIISDGTSLSILLQELCDLYNGNTLPEKQVDYKDFSLWEKEQFEKEEFKNSKAFWVNQYKDEIPLLNMPTTFARPSVQSFEGCNYHTKLSKEVFEKVNEVSKNLGITPYMLMLSVYYILLSKYTSQDDIVIGTPIVGRELPELSNMLGMFVNTLALRSEIDHSITFGKFANTIKEYCLSAFQNQAYPFDELVKELDIKRDTSRNPLVDVMFAYQNNGYPEINFKEAATEYFTPDSNISKFDLTLEIIPIDNELSLRFEYCTKLFDEDFIRRLSSHYINILNAILENQDIKIADIDMLSKEEKNQILYDFNNTAIDYPHDKTVVDLFEGQVEKTPDNIAVIFEDQKLTYRELNEKANQLACYLISQGIKSNSVIGIMLPRSLNLLICMLAILKTGNAYLLIDCSLPTDRIDFMLKNANSEFVLTNQKYEKINYKKVLLDNIQLENYSNENLSIKTSANDIFCTIYTSGSTGIPKGSLIKNSGVVNLVYSYKQVLNVDICDTFLSISTVSFDMFIVETAIPLLLGKTIILSNDEEQKIPMYICKLINNYDVDFLLSTPSRVELLLEPSTINCLKTLKVLQLGGEVFTDKLLSTLKSSTNARIYNGYGPSEITACCSSKDLTNCDKITIGTPMCNTQIYILDKDLNLCPQGVTGEIYVAGDGVSNGYINNPEATKKAFLKNPFNGNIMYKTGDLGFYNNDLELVFVGRKDDQIKIRGLRIELSEIENDILSIPGISSCTVLYNNTSNEPFICSFYCSDKDISSSNIREILSSKLPLYMVPKYFVKLDKLPVTTNGKVDKKLLLKYNFNDLQNQNYVAPENDLQKILCETWQNLLGRKVGIDDNIFESGADSLIAIKFKTILFENNIDINYSDIFSHPTVRQLADIQTQSSDTNLDFNYLNNILSNTNKDKSLVHCENNNVILLGANGFVGMHIIENFIKNDTGKIYCIIRNKKDKSAEERFLETSHFYFGKELDSYINNRILIINGDLSDSNLGMNNDAFNALINDTSTILNCAAIVKHYGNYDDFKKVNIDIIDNIINICLKYNKRFIHLSTMSISENVNIDNTTLQHKFSSDTVFSEKKIYIGQQLENIYVRSKFEAEKLIIEHISKGLNAQILRLGNMTSRFIDGKFQINPETNMFANHIKAFLTLKHIPNYLMNTPIEFTPVDLCAKAIIKILQNYNKNNIVYHLYNHNTILVNDLINMLNEDGFTLSPISHEDFIQNLHNALSMNETRDKVSMLVSDLDENKKFNFMPNLKLDSTQSISFLENAGFTWPKIDNIYIQKYMKHLKEIKFI